MNMKKILTFLLILLTFTSFSQLIVFFDSFDQGLGNWDLTGTWGSSTTAFSAPYSMTESPVGNYTDVTTMYATMDTTVDLSNCMDATLEFTAKYSIEFGFDFMYVDISPDGGQTWYNLTSFTGDSLGWYKYVFYISGFVGYSEVKARFRFESDDLLNFDGMYIDNFLIITYSGDISAPFIVHNPKPHYEGLLYENPMETEIFDISGVSDTKLHYTVDNVLQTPIVGVNTTGNKYLYVIPSQPPGSWIDYWFTATDASIAFNSDTTEMFQYIAGNYIKYDDGEVDFINELGYNSLSFQIGCAVRFTLNGLTNIVSALIRNYTDSNSPNSQMQVHVWSNNNGVPGTDLITPLNVMPQCNLAQPNKITRIDLRSFASTLSNLTGDVFVGFTVPAGSVWVSQSTPATAHRTYSYDLTYWTLLYDDYQFRIVTSTVAGSPVPDFSYDATGDPAFQFTDLTTGSPNAWYWTFGDNGAISYDQNPMYTFTENGIFNVCLTASNDTGSVTHCEQLTIAGCQPPVAAFATDTTYSPEILFSDQSDHYPELWTWDFDNNGVTSNYQNTMYTFPENGTYNVCLTVENSEGSDTACQQIIIDDYTAPDAAFSYNASAEPVVHFFDESSNEITNTPASWYWDFDDLGIYSTSQNPVHTFTTNGIFNVCLTATNNEGSSTFCNIVVIDNYVIPVANFTTNNYLSPTIAFIDLTSDSIICAPTSWLWDFDDIGTTSTQQSPVHTFSQNDTFNVCLIVANTIGSDTICHDIIIDDYALPVAGFNINSSGMPHIHFTDISSGVPTSWYWDFSDGTGSTLHNPSHTFSSNGDYNVCLIAGNYIGSDTICQEVNIDSYLAPVADFSFIITNDSIVQFTDLSANLPNEWFWDFDDNTEVSYEQNPVHTFHAQGTYNVCLTSSSINGASSPFCNDVQIVINSIDLIGNDVLLSLYPNPFSEVTYISLASGRDYHSITINVHDVFGRLIPVKYLQQNNTLILFRGSLSDGMYYFELNNSTGKMGSGSL